MRPMPIQLGEWLPDQPELANPGALVARNVVPRAVGYGQLQTFEPVTAAAGERILGGAWLEANGNIEVVVGTPTRILRLLDNAWSAIGTGYPNVVNWEFAVFGEDVYAVAPGVQPQRIDMGAGSPSAVNAPGSPSAPPGAGRVAVVGDFIVLGDITANPNLIQWSGYNNAGVWDPNGDVLTQADSQELFEGGRVQKIVGGTIGYVFQERRIRTVRYAGPPLVFEIQVINYDRGAVAADSVVRAGDRVFFYAQDGFHEVRGGSFNPIGRERVDRWFLENAASDDITNVRGVVDRSNNLVLWAFRSNSALDNYDLALIYNYAINRWSYAEIGDIGIATLFEIRSAGYNLDTLATLLPGGMATDVINMDSPAYKGGRLAVYGASDSGSIGSLTGAALDATIDTGEFEPGEAKRASLSGIRPIVEGGSGTTTTVQLGRRNTLSAPVDWTPERGLNALDEASILSDARYHRVRLNISGGFQRATRADAILRPSGRF